MQGYRYSYSKFKKREPLIAHVENMLRLLSATVAGCGEHALPAARTSPRGMAVENMLCLLPEPLHVAWLWRGPGSRQSMLSIYARLYSYSKFKKRKPLIALGSHQEGGGGLISASAVPHSGPDRQTEGSALEGDRFANINMASVNRQPCVECLFREVW